MPSFQLRDGQMVEIPDTIITESCELSDTINNTTIVRGGNVHVLNRGKINGTLRIDPGAMVETHGTVNGTVHVASGAEYIVHGQHNGALHVDVGGRARVMANGSLMGTTSGGGELLNEGTRSSHSSGMRHITDAPGSQVRMPDETLPDGTSVYLS